MRKKIFWFGTMSIMAIAFAGLVYVLGGTQMSGPVTEKPSIGESEKLRIVATVYPLAEFARMVAGDRAEVMTIVSGSIEPHAYEPTPRDMIAARQADIFLQNGGGFDVWADEARRLLDATRIKTLVLADVTKAAEDETVLNASFSDPHFWLDPTIASTFLASLRDALIDRDPDNAGTYRENTRLAMEHLSVIDAAYRTRLALCAHREIIVSHDALGFLERRYGFVSYALAGLSPEEDPSSKRIAEIADLAKKQNIRYIFFEERVSPKVAETLAEEAGVQTLSIDLVESVSEDARGYFASMEKNLKYLAQAMECY